MRIVKWDDLPDKMKNKEVRPYYNILVRKQKQLAAKRVFDIIFSLFMLIILSPLFLVIAVWIKLDSRGPVFFRQERVTQYGRHFRIFKFRTMVENAEKLGSQVTEENDRRITRAGLLIRKKRLDELPQLLNVLSGDMTFVGVRPEVPHYVEQYSDKMYATLLLPAGITSNASIAYRDEGVILSGNVPAEEAYVNLVLPEKMKYNLEDIRKYNFFRDIEIMVKTVAVVLR